MGTACCADCARRKDDEQPASLPVPPCAGDRAEEWAGGPANQELLRLARSAQRSALTVGAADDPAEREADAAAMRVAAGVPVRRSPWTGAAGAPSVSRALPPGGRPLEDGTRRDMGTALGADFSGVRVHDGAEAAKSAVGVGARAYTLGADIVFAPGQYSPSSASGRRLLAHELVHVLQQPRGEDRVLRRQATPAAPEPAPAPPATPAVGLDTDVCLVVEGALSNDALLAQAQRVEQYLGARKRGQDDFYAYANLGARLAEERRRRVKMGHVYLVGAAGEVPSELYRLTQAGDRLWVSTEDPGRYHGMPFMVVGGYVVTRSQFGRALEDLHIPQVDVGEYFATQGRDAALQLIVPPRPVPPPLAVWPPFGPPTAAGTLDVVSWPGTGPAGAPGGSAAAFRTAIGFGGINQSLFALNAAGALSRPLQYTAGSARSRAGALSEYRGDLPEIAFGRGSLPAMVTQADLNAVAPDFRVFDYRARLGGGTTSVTSTMATPPVATGPRPVGPIDTRPNWRTYDAKFARAFGQQQQANFAAATADLNVEFGTTLAPRDVAAGATLRINDDHVEAMRARLRTRIPDDPNGFAQVIDGVLHAQPVELRTAAGGTVHVAGWNDLQAARPGLAPADYRSALDVIAEMAASRVLPSGILTEQLVRLVTLREFLRTLTPEQYRAQVPPELVDAIRYRGGTPEAALRAGGRGALVQGGVGAGFDFYRMATDERAHPHWALESGSRAALQAGGGALTASSETAIVASANEALLGRTGASALLQRGGARLAGGVGPAMVVAPLVTAGSMALDELFTDAYYTDIDYAVAATRSGVAAGGGAVIGAGAGAGAAALAGMVAGSPVPVVGNVVGLVAGFVGYLIVDAIVGDELDRSMRLAMGEGGCPRPPRPTALPEPEFHFCFVAGTEVRLADGDSRPIECLRRGDRVLGVDVAARELCPEVVERVVVQPETPVVSLAVAGGSVLRCTPGHPLFDGAAWRRAGDLAAGDTVLVHDADGDRLATSTVIACTVDRPEPVVDISVSGMHTFLADGVVAHNKVF